MLADRVIDDVVQLEACRFLLRFSEPPFPRVHIAVHPRLSTIHLARGLKAPAAPTELSVELTRELAGRRIVSVTKPASERLVRIETTGGRVLIVELMGKASDVILVGPDSRIHRFARGHQGEFRQPAVGEIYLPPPPYPRRVVPDPGSLTRTLFEGLRKDAGERFSDRLVESIPGLSVPVAREVEHRAEKGEDAWQVFVELLERSSSGPRTPLLYSPAPPAELAESQPLSSRNLFAAVFPLTHAAGLAATPAPTANEAEEMATACMVRRMMYETVQLSLATLLRREDRRIQDLLGVLEAELAAAELAGTIDRRRGELILAGLHEARKEGGSVRVVDHYDPQGGLVEIPIDPRLGLNENAQRYFKSARRSARTRQLAPTRLRGLKERLRRVEQAAGRVQGAGTRAELESIERDLQEAGIVRAFRKTDRAEVGRAAEYVRVHEFRTREGFLVLVGRTAAENDHLTFKVAAPHDLWLHAAGQPGAHVVVRNPKRLQALPESTVQEAAAIAAWFSKGKTETALDVHVAWRRHVRKGRGMSPGMVVLKRHRTVRVDPRSARLTSSDAP